MNEADLIFLEAAGTPRERQLVSEVRSQQHTIEALADALGRERDENQRLSASQRVRHSQPERVGIVLENITRTG